MLTGLAPVLLVPDVEAALAHYRDVLGFETEPYVDGGAAVYGFAMRDSCSIHFALCNLAPRANDALSLGMPDVYVAVDDVDALHHELVGRGAGVLEPPTDRAYGMRDLLVRDANGYILGFGQPLE